MNGPTRERAPEAVTDRDGEHGGVEHGNSTPTGAPESGPKVHAHAPPREGSPDSSEIKDKTDGGSEVPEGSDGQIPVTQRDRLRHWWRRARAVATACGMDFSPPAYRSPLPPLAEAIDHADQGTWAPPRGPARLSGRVYARLVLPARWVVRLLDAVLARPGRLVVAGLLVWLLTRIPGASEITTGVLAILGWPLVALWWLLTL